MELLIILVILLLLFGASRLPKLARSLGQASAELRTALRRHEPAEERDRERSHADPGSRHDDADTATEP